MTEIKARPGPFRVSESAARRIGEILATEGQPDLKLRITVSGGGVVSRQVEAGQNGVAEVAMGVVRGAWRWGKRLGRGGGGSPEAACGGRGRWRGSL